MSPDILIQHNTFDELDDSDAVHGFGGGVIRGNHMDHALPHGGGNHNDFIQIGAGGPWTIEATRSACARGGAASIWLDPINGGLIHDAVISEQRRHRPLRGPVRRHPRGRGRNHGRAPAAQHPAVVNNTVISGLSNSLRFGREYATLPARAAAAGREQHRRALRRHVRPRPQRPQRLRVRRRLHAERRDRQPPSRARRDRRTHRRKHAADQPGRSRVRPGHPTSSPSCAPSALPDIGAIEVGAGPAAPPPPPARNTTAPRLVSAQGRRAAFTRVVVRVRTRNAHALPGDSGLPGRAHRREGQRTPARQVGVRLRLKAPRRGKLVAPRPRGGARTEAIDAQAWTREGASVTQARLDALVAFALAGRCWHSG